MSTSRTRRNSGAGPKRKVQGCWPSCSSIRRSRNSRVGFGGRLGPSRSGIIGALSIIRSMIIMALRGGCIGSRWRGISRSREARKGKILLWYWIRPENLSGYCSRSLYHDLIRVSNPCDPATSILSKTHLLLRHCDSLGKNPEANIHLKKGLVTNKYTSIYPHQAISLAENYKKNTFRHQTRMIIPNHLQYSSRRNIYLGSTTPISNIPISDKLTKMEITGAKEIMKYKKTTFISV